MYDLRSSKPLLVKDHMYGLPIKRVLFTEGSEEEGRVLSMDSQVVRLWERESGKAYTSIEATAEFNDIVLYPKSGLLFLANEQPRMQVLSLCEMKILLKQIFVGLLHSLSWSCSPLGLLP